MRHPYVAIRPATASTIVAVATVVIPVSVTPPPSLPSPPAPLICIQLCRSSPMPMPLPMPMPVPVPVRASASHDASHDASRNEISGIISLRFDRICLANAVASAAEKNIKVEICGRCRLRGRCPRDPPPPRSTRMEPDASDVRIRPATLTPPAPPAPSSPPARHGLL